MGDDLDAILKSLGGGGISGIDPAAPKVAASGDDDLSNILGKLTMGAGAGPSINDLAKAQGPLCAACNNVVIGPAVSAMGRAWHVEHFACAQCSVPFMGGKFIPRDNKPYCDGCYSELFQIRCYKCSEPIVDKCVTVFEKNYHPHHFMCAKCDAPLAGKQYYNHEGTPICKDCRELVLMELHKDKEVELCGKCGKPIYGEYIVLGDKKIHPEHFSCAQCGIHLRGGDSFEWDEKLYCKKDYNFLVSTTCYGCKQPIEGRAFSAMGKQWHPEHFVCAVCDKEFEGGKFYERDNKPYCPTHFHERFGAICEKCQKPISSKAVQTLTKQWHEDCFMCVGCDKKLTGQNFRDYDLKPMCVSCFGKLPSDVRKKAEKEATERKDAENKAKKEEEKKKKEAEKAAKK